MRARESGQAVVETAIVMPLFTFLLLGILQISLMHQARLMTRYAAYKAARAGSLGSAKMDRMETAALAVLLPLMASDKGGGKELNFKTDNASNYTSSFMQVRSNMMPDVGLKYVEVTICSPNKDMLKNAGGSDSSDEIGFDAKDTITDQNWNGFDRTRLSVQVTFNYRMVVPFANMFLWHMTFGDENMDIYRAYRLGFDPRQLANKAQEIKNKYSVGHDQGIYVFPIRANWSMRMQSNLFPNESGYELPQTNDCVIRFPKKGSGGGGVGVVDSGGDDVDQN